MQKRAPIFRGYRTGPRHVRRRDRISCVGFEDKGEVIEGQRPQSEAFGLKCERGNLRERDKRIRISRDRSHPPTVAQSASSMRKIIVYVW